jgi:predicted ATPase
MVAVCDVMVASSRRVMAYIRRIHVEPFRCVPRLDIDLGVEPTQSEETLVEPHAPTFRHLIITGPNGSGKTSLISGIAEHVPGLNPTPSAGTASPEAAPIAITWSQDLYATFGPRGPLYAFRRAREVLTVSPVTSVEKSSLASPELVPAQLLQYLVNLKAEQAFLLAEGDHASAAQIEDFFLRLRSLVRRVLQDDHAELIFVRAAYNFVIKRADGLTFDFNQLADGHAAALAVAAQLLLRIDALQRGARDRTLQPEGVVVVDEVEAHLHPTMQQEILPILTEFFPTLQFIVATHSPAVIASVPNATVLDLGSQTSVRSEDLMGLRYGAILKGHFGLPEDLDADTSAKLHRLRAIAVMPARDAAETQEFAALADELSQRSAELGTEIWLLRNGLTERTKRAS